jgi:hypothetical protein
MRAGPLSNQKVIDLLNGYFVPVYTVNEDYAKNGPAPKEEKAERERIFKAGYAAKKSVGSVHVYLLSPDGEFIDSLHVAEAAKPKTLIALLEKTVTALKLSQGSAVVTVRPQSETPACEKDCLALHLVSRSLDGKGAWSEFPVENWIVLSPADQREFTGGGKEMRPGETWEIGADTAKKLLTHFYPATENNDVSKNRFLEQKLTATLVGKENGVARARLNGTFKMEHSFYHKPDGKTAEGSVIGYIEFPPGNGQIASFDLVTEKASYAGGTFGIAVRAVR